MRGCSLSTGAFLLSRLNRPSVTKSFPAFRGFEMQSSFPRLWKARPSWRRHLVRSKVVSSVNLRFSSYSLGVKETSFYPTMPNLSAVRVLFSFFLPFSLSLSLSLSRLLNFPPDVIPRASGLFEMKITPEAIGVG